MTPPDAPERTPLVSVLDDLCELAEDAESDARLDTAWVADVARRAGTLINDLAALRSSSVSASGTLRQRIEKEIEGQEAYARQGPSPAWPNVTPEYHRGIAAVLKMILLADSLSASPAPGGGPGTSAQTED